MSIEEGTQMAAALTKGVSLISGQSESRSAAAAEKSLPPLPDVAQLERGFKKAFG